MVNNKTIFFASLAIILIALFAVFYSNGAKIKYDDSVEGLKAKNIAPALTSAMPIATPKQPAPTIKIVASTPTSQPTMKEIPEISINSPNNIAKGDKFTLEFQINSKGEKIVGLEMNIGFDGKLIEAEKVNIPDANSDGTYLTGNIGSGEIKNIAIAKQKGNVAENFATIEFKAINRGNVQIKAQITAVNEKFIYTEIEISKIIEIV